MNADRVAVRVLRAGIVAAIEADMARVDRMLSLLDVIDGDPDLEADHVTVERDAAGTLYSQGRDADDEPGDNGLADLDGAQEQLGARGWLQASDSPAVFA